MESDAESDGLSPKRRRGNYEVDDASERSEEMSEENDEEDDYERSRKHTRRNRDFRDVRVRIFYCKCFQN